MTKQKLSPTNKNVDSNEEESQVLKIGSVAFWELFSTLFPFQPNLNIVNSGPTSRLDYMNGHFPQLLFRLSRYRHDLRGTHECLDYNLSA